MSRNETSKGMTYEWLLDTADHLGTVATRCGSLNTFEEFKVFRKGVETAIAELSVFKNRDIAKKMEKHLHTDGNTLHQWWSLHCGFCDELFVNSTYQMPPEEERPIFCPHCGQRVDWSGKQ